MRYRLARTIAALTLAATVPPATAGDARVVGLPAVARESSGLAVSRRDPALLWTHNDSGGEPVLFAVDAQGRLRGTLRVAGVQNRDWEDLAAFELDGRAWLLIADVGDNAGNRENCALHVVPEPDPAGLSPEAETTVRVAWSVPVRYLDGPRDVEAVAVDAAAGEVWLLAKRTRPHGLYRLALRPDPRDRVTPAALPVAQVPNAFFPPAPPELALLPTVAGRWRPQPTGMDFAPDGSAAAVVSYGDVLIFQRQPGEDWADALTREPRNLGEHGLYQAEGVAFGPDGREIFVSSEGRPPALWRGRVETPDGLTDASE